MSNHEHTTAADDRQTLAWEKYEQQKREFFNSCTSERNRFIASKTDEAKSYDQTILTFSAGAIGLSLTFVEKIAPAPTTPVTLYASWSFFAAAVLSVIISFVISQAAMDSEIAWIDASWERVSAGNKDLPEKRANRYSKLTRIVNWASGLLFVGGITMLVVFGAQNWPNSAGGGKLPPKSFKVEITGEVMPNAPIINVNTTTVPSSNRGNPPAPALIQPAPQPPTSPAPAPKPAPAPATKT